MTRGLGVTREHVQVDVFGEEPYLGNPLPVVLDGSGLSTEQMLTVTRWFNQSETTFLLPPTQAGADYAVRIFTPSGELPFAGHPTLGTCHAWLQAGGVPAGDEIVQECGVGLVRLRRAADGSLAFAAPPLIRAGPVADDDLDRFVSVLGIDRDDVVDAAWCDNGPGWVGIELADAEAVLALRPRLADDDAAGLFLGVVGSHGDGGPADVEVRAFFPSENGSLIEDPVTGSLNASLAQWRFATGPAIGGYVARQGTALGRRGRVVLTHDDDGTVWVGGTTTTVVRGTIEA